MTDRGEIEAKRSSPTAPQHFAKVARDAQRFEVSRIVGCGIANYVEMPLTGPPFPRAQIVHQMGLGVPRQDFTHLREEQ